MYPSFSGPKSSPDAVFGQACPASRTIWAGCKTSAAPAVLIFWNTLMNEAKSGSTPATDDQADGKAALPQDFETALAQLESLVSQMETGALPLDRSLAAYEQGVELAKICQRRLDQAEQQVKVLQGNLLKPLADVDSGEE